jgi:hypothetical protein
MRRARLAAISALLLFSSLAYAPTVLAATATTTFTITPNPCALPSCTTVSALDLVSADPSTCPSIGGTWSFTFFITPPSGPTTSIGPLSGMCGIHHGAVFKVPAELAALYPPVCGSWTLEEKGTTSTGATFDDTGTLIVSGCSTPVPQFPYGSALLLAVIMPALIVFRKWAYPRRLP